MADEVTSPQPPEPGGGLWARRRRTLRRTGWGVLAALAIAVAAAGVDIATSDRSGGGSLRAKPGDCFAGDSDGDLRRVECDDRAVRWTVIGVAEHRTEKDAKQKACEAWPEAQASYWESRNGTDGFVLCLGPVALG